MLNFPGAPGQAAPLETSPIPFWFPFSVHAATKAYGVAVDAPSACSFLQDPVQAVAGPLLGNHSDTPVLPIHCATPGNRANQADAPSPHSHPDAKYDFPMWGMSSPSLWMENWPCP